jgi:hypothetical protein
MLKKAGIVVLGATAGMISLAPLASAGEAHHGHGDRAHSSSDDCSGATAIGGEQRNSGDQGLLGINNTNIQAPINQVGVLSRYDNDCDGDDDRRGHRHGHRHGHDHDRHDHDRHDGDRHDGDRRGGGSGGASAEGGDQRNSGDQGLIGINNTNIQAPINQLGILSSYDND